MSSPTASGTEKQSNKFTDFMTKTYKKEKYIFLSAAVDNRYVDSQIRKNFTKQLSNVDVTINPKNIRL